MVDQKILRDMAFFGDFTDEELTAISKIVKKKSYKIGEPIFKENEDGTSMYIIRKGEVKACKAAPDGELMTLTLMKDGDIFGEMSFLDERPRSATIVAISSTEAYSIEKYDFEKLIDSHPRMVYKMLKNIIFTVHTIVRGMNTRYIEMVNYMWGRRR
ncbi:MAG: cyclic nucleotide-binding domain-containing protein [Deltaproteobacteria bacterium]|nr:cyclic nucleotide-binding domain-containing protein [Deltaproteobacteria bacterium]